MSVVRIPATDLVGNLMWTRSGTVWATWRLTGLAYNGTIEDKRAAAAAHRLLSRCLGGESLWLSCIVPQDPVTVVSRMLDGLDLAATPMWVAECEASLDRMADLGLGERHHWLAVPLPNPGRRRVAEPARSAWRSLLDLLDAPVRRPDPAEVAARTVQARQVQDLIPAPFHPVPTDYAEQLWLASHAQRRGQLDLPLPSGDDTATDLLRSAAGLTEPLLDEGARTDQDGPGRLNVLKQRVLKVTDLCGVDSHGFQPSYQALLAVADTPAGGIAFPGSEWLFELDRVGVDVDWAIRVRANARDQVLDRNRKAVRKLNEQFDQREAEGATGRHDLDLAAQLLTEYAAIFATDRQEVEIEHTILLAVAAARTDPEQGDAEVNAACQDQAALLAKLLHDAAGLKLERPPGYQAELWWGMQVGVPTSPVVRAYAQVTTSEHFSKLVPFIDIRLGGRTGPVPMVSTSTSRPRPVHLDIAGYPELDIGGDMMIVAEKGAGKSFFQKTLCAQIVARGGQICAIDKSEDGEWERFITQLGSHQVVDALHPTHSMDPLRILPGAAGAEVLQSFLVQWLGLDNHGPTGTLLARLLRPAYLEQHRIDSSAALLEHLAGLAAATPGGRSEAATTRLDTVTELHERLAAVASREVARVVFDPTLPPADLSVDALLWRTQGTEQPNSDELLHEHLFRQMPPEKVFGRAYYRLITGTARRLLAADPSREAVFVLDELNDVTENPENVRDIQHIVRRGRRIKGFILAGAHDADDIRDEVLSGLIPTRVLMRHRDENLARRGLRWLGIREHDPDFAGYLETVTTDMSPVLGDTGVPPQRRGECYLRDAFGNFGPARVLPPADPTLAAAVRTTPPKQTVRR